MSHTCKNTLYVTGMCGKPKKQPWCLGNCPGKKAECPEHWKDVHKQFSG